MKEKLCSSCGLCMIKEWPAKENIQSCVLKNRRQESEFRK